MKNARRISGAASLLLAATAVATLGAIEPASADTAPAADCSLGTSCTVTMGPGTYTWTVPTGVTSVRLEVDGAQGGAYGGTSGGRGGEALGSVSVSGGTILNVVVGAAADGVDAGAGGGGAPGIASYPLGPGAGGGGGGSFVFDSAGAALLVAGGGGGGAAANYGGDGGAPGAAAGAGVATNDNSDIDLSSGVDPAWNGGAAQTTANGVGGAAGPYCTAGTSGSGPAATLASQPTGGTGGDDQSEGDFSGGGGGGGGGYYAGGGGAGCDTPGGGGSGYAAPALTSVSGSAGARSGNGRVAITYSFDQTVSFTSTGPSTPVVGGTYIPTATSTSGLGAGLQVDAATASVCSMSSGTVSFNHVGTCTIDASQAGGGGYAAAQQVQQSVTVAKAPQSVSFTSTAPTSPGIGATYTPTATATSGLAVVLTVDSASASVCSMSDGTVHLDHAGTCTIDANQPGDADHLAAPPAQQSVSVNKAAQTIAFSPAPAGRAIGGGYTPAATATSGLAVSFTVDAESGTVCSLVAGRVAFEHAGDCTIDADQPGDGDHTAAPTVHQTVTVDRTGQSIAFTSTVPDSVVVGDSYVLGAASTTGGGSGNTVTYSVDATSGAGVCSLTAGTVSFDQPGTCVIAANQAGAADYFAASPVTHAVTVLDTQSITLAANRPTTGVIGGSFSPTADGGGSTSPVTFSVSGSACSLAGGTVSFDHAGACVVSADQAGDATHAAAPERSWTIQIARDAQDVAFTAVPTGGEIGGSWMPAATGGGSGNPVAFSVDASSDVDVCSLVDGTVSFAHAGTCVIAADQMGDNDYLHGHATASVTVAKTAQTIAFAADAVATATTGGAWTPVASSSADLPVSYSVDPTSGAGVCSLSDGTVSFDRSGTCVIAADQAGSDDVAAAPTVLRTIEVRDATVPPAAGLQHVRVLRTRDATSPYRFTLAIATGGSGGQARVTALVKVERTVRKRVHGKWTTAHQAVWKKVASSGHAVTGTTTRLSLRIRAAEIEKWRPGIRRHAVPVCLHVVYVDASGARSAMDKTVSAG